MFFSLVGSFFFIRDTRAGANDSTQNRTSAVRNAWRGAPDCKV